MSGTAEMMRNISGFLLRQAFCVMAHGDPLETRPDLSDWFTIEYSLRIGQPSDTQRPC
jgi:hypothetical protein